MEADQFYDPMAADAGHPWYSETFKDDLLRFEDLRKYYSGKLSLTKYTAKKMRGLISELQADVNKIKETIDKGEMEEKKIKEAIDEGEMDTSG